MTTPAAKGRDSPRARAARFSISLYLWLHDAVDQDLNATLDERWRVFRSYFLEEYEEVGHGIHPDIAPMLRRHLVASGAFAEVRREDGTRIFMSDGFRMGDPRYLGRTDRVVTPQGETFVIHLAIDTLPYHHPLAQLRLYFLIFCPIILIIAGWLGSIFVRRALLPVEEIRRQAERISRANVSERVPEPELKGEFQDLARTFNEMLDRLDRAFQDLDNFAADAAHELRTPLATLKAEIETALEHSCPQDENVLLSLAEEVSRMNRIVTDLFTLAKLDMRQYALQKERVPVTPLLRETCETWRPVAAERGITVVLQGPDAVVAGDPVALRRVFMNLVENAVTYNHDGGKITISVARSNGKVRIGVEDTGIGIPPEHLPRIFHRFYRVDKGRSRESGGAGLGLALCRSYIEAHEGKIEVSSSPEQGTSFTVEIPALE